MSEVVSIPQLRFPEFRDEWRVDKFVDLCKFQQGVQVDVELQSTEPKNNFLRFLRIENYTQKSNDFRYIPKELSSNKSITENEIAIVRYGATAGYIGRGLKGVLANNLFKLVLNKDTLDTDYLFHLLRSYKTFCFFQSEMSGGAMPALSFGIVGALKLPYSSISEQQKIAAFLSAVDNKIEQLSKKQALLGSWKKGLMQQIFSQAIRFKADDGSAFPVWEEKNIVELAKTSIGLVTSMTPYYVDKGVPLIRNNDIFQNKIRKEKLIRLDYEFDQLNKNRRLFTNDIVTVHTGNIGASAVIDEELNGCQGFATLNTRIKNQNEISSSFLCWYYNSTRNIKYALSMATGDGRSNYNLKDFNKATIPVPSLPEQTKIAAFLTAADNKIEQVGKQFDESKQFKKALLQQMFV